MIRNAGGRASDDAIRSLVISHKLLGTEEWFVVHHTDCGMELFTDEVMRSLLKQSSTRRKSTPMAGTMSVVDPARLKRISSTG